MPKLILPQNQYPCFMIWVAVAGNNKLVAAQYQDHAAEMCKAHYGVGPQAFFQIPYYTKDLKKPNAVQ